jgi:hypothetical protein
MMLWTLFTLEVEGELDILAETEKTKKKQYFIVRLVFPVLVQMGRGRGNDG